MKKLTLLGLVLGTGLLGSQVYAQYSHPCENIYWEINRAATHDSFETEYDRSDYLSCLEFQEAIGQTGETSLIKKAEAYKKKVADREEKIEALIEQRKEVARGERAGKIVKTFSEEELRSVSKGILKGAPAVSSATVYITRTGRREVENEKIKSDPNVVCKALGFEKSLGYTEGEEFEQGIRNDREEMDFDKINIMMTVDKFFGGKETVVFQQDVTSDSVAYKKGWDNDEAPETYVASKNDDYKKAEWHSYNFRLFSSLECEREIEAGEELQDFEINIGDIEKAVNDEVDRPTLTDEVAQLLSLDDYKPGSRANRAVADGSRRKSEDVWKPRDYGESEFIYKPSTQSK